MADETTQADAAALVAMTVADLAQHLDGVDLATLLAAKELEQASPSPRKGALAALDAALEGHPEAAGAAAAAADAVPADQPVAPAPAEQPAPAPADANPSADIPAMRGVPDDTAAAPLADAPVDPEAVSVAPPRPHDSLVSALELRWIELKDFARPLAGEVEGELGELLTFVRSKL